MTLAKDGYYDGIIFHRVIEDFMIQGGDPTGTGMGGDSIFEEGPFEDEFDPKYHHFRGALSMANRGENTNTSQFFVVQAKDVDPIILYGIQEPDMLLEEYGVRFRDLSFYQELGQPVKDNPKQWMDDATIERYMAEGGTPHLDGKHTVFGFLTEGYDVLDNIAAVNVDTAYKPLEDVIIESIHFVME